MPAPLGPSVSVRPRRKVIPPITSPAPAVDPDGPNPFERLVRLVRSNEALLSTLQDVKVATLRARAYLADPGCNVALGTAQVERLRRRRSAVLCRLRANRIEASHLLNGAAC